MWTIIQHSPDLFQQQPHMKRTLDNNHLTGLRLTDAQSCNLSKYVHDASIRDPLMIVTIEFSICTVPFQQQQQVHFSLALG
jgi:hypothetical protein